MFECDDLHAGAMSVRQVFRRGRKQLLDVRCELLFGRRRFRLYGMSGNANVRCGRVFLYECQLQHLLLRGEPHLQPSSQQYMLSEQFGMRCMPDVFGQ